MKLHLHRNVECYYGTRSDIITAPRDIRGIEERWLHGFGAALSTVSGGLIRQWAPTSVTRWGWENMSAVASGRASAVYPGRTLRPFPGGGN